MPIYEFQGNVPDIDSTAFVHPLASVIGDVRVGAGCYIGPFASIRGDFGTIIIGEGSNVQDSCTLHVGHGRRCELAPASHVGHGAVVHSAVLQRNALIGMNAVVMDDAVIGESAIVAACAFVKSGWEVPSGCLVAGIPARVVRQLEQDELREKIEATRKYQDLAAACLSTMHEAKIGTDNQVGNCEGLRPV
ncbi:carbonic anhydrase [Paraburkholderia hospita]|uniref:Carbonic anhydrase n=1 Tax=Paraburkholderia hospita TaxID=169430 RepID=A0ABN0F9G1_9BURK|nr:phenylacetic acid degradation protein PaaY [Paraburkholderia hospita]EIM95311.1 carbonic anhydrase [Paraburkholderia hospita]OUL84674.1 phenylacetic acid degradation protein PaaY [Paraburkholderia hospita]